MLYKNAKLKTVFAGLATLAIALGTGAESSAHAQTSKIRARSYSQPRVEKTTADRLLTTNNTSKPHLRSREGREIAIYRTIAAGKNEQGIYRFLIQGGLHGDELLAHGFVSWLLKRYTSGSSALNKLSADGAAFDFIPSANPDGLAKSSRLNSGGINLNRNYGVLWGVSREPNGSAAFSEPETQVIRKLMTKYRYTGAVDVHGYVNWVVVPSSPKELASRKGGKSNLDVGRYRRAEYRKWVHEVRQQTSTMKTYEVKTAGSLGDGGAFEDWAFWKAGAYAFCLEMLSPKDWVRFAGPQPTQESVFLKYERYLAKMFKRAIRLKQSRSVAKTSHQSHQSHPNL